MQPGREPKATDAVRILPQTSGNRRGCPGSPAHTPRRPEEVGGLVIGLPSGRWGRTGPGRPAGPPTRLPGRSGAGGPGGGGKREGDPAAGRSRRCAVLGSMAIGAGVGGLGALLRPVAWKLNQRRDISSWLAKWFPNIPAKPVVALKTPIKVELVAGKTYRWCVCGLSKQQPFCDGSHIFQFTGLFPLKFKAKETRTVLLCTCKATQKPPYCDGTHKSERVQKAELGSPF